MFKMKKFSMDSKVLIILILMSSMALSQTPWREVSTSKYELTFYNSTTSSFNNARSICQNIGADLIQLDDIYVRNIFYEIIPQIPADTMFFWIGATGKMRKWKWLNGKKVDMALITWKAGKPDQTKYKETGVICYAKTGFFGDVPINFEYAIPTCQRKRVITFGIHILTFYRFDKDGNSYTRNYNSAQLSCNSHKSRLAYITETNEAKIRNYITNGPTDIYWVDGKTGSNCMTKTRTGDISKPCTDTYYYVCEKVQTNSIFLEPNFPKIALPSQTTMICAASGYPSPDVEWTKNNNTVSTSVSNLVYQIQITGRSVLHLENAKVTDEDKYTCNATNSFGGSTFTQNKQLRVRVPSTPKIKTATANSCNSSFVIEWKPHHRAIGVKHRFRFFESANKVDGEIYMTPSDDKTQYITTGNLSSSTQYNITIEPCSDINNCYSYVASKTSTTGGIPGPVSNAVLNKSGEECMVSWSLPKITRSAFITRFKIVVLPFFAQPPVGVNATINGTSMFVDSSMLSYIIPKLPNRKYSVTVQAETCAGVGNILFASGKCVTDTAAPAFVAEAELPVNSSISEDGTLEINVQSPDETNGPISCIFLIVKIIKKVKTSEKYSEEHLRKLNGNSSTMTDEYISIVAGPRTFESIRLKSMNSNTLHITLGDGNTTECNIRKTGISSRMKRAINNSSGDIFNGSNRRLMNDETYELKIVTSTPSGNKVLFQESDALAINYIPPPKSQTPFDQQSWIMPTSIGSAIFIAVLVLILLAFVIRRRKKTIGSRSIFNDVSSDLPMDEAKSSRNTSNKKNEAVISYKDTIANDEDDTLYENHTPVTTVEMSKLEDYFTKLTMDDNAIFCHQFQDIVRKSKACLKSSEVALDPELKKKNRYKNILPFDSTRVILQGNEIGYINACHIHGFNKKIKYIATQGPLASTVNDFWLMVVQQECKVIVMLAKCFEAGKKKCQKYWPELDQTMTFGSITVKNVEEIKFCGFVQRCFRVGRNNDEETMLVFQYQYLKWPDHGVPITTSNLVRMQKAVTKKLRENGENSSVIVHCSAGAGRTGTYIGYDILREESESESQTNIDLFNCVMEMRSQRVDMIQNCDQYILLHKLILENYLFGETDFPSHEVAGRFPELISDKKVLSSEFELLSETKRVKTTEKKISNKANNVTPTDRNAVVIPPEEGDAVPPRIDAYWVEAYDENSLMIATRAPVKSTVQYFWRAVLYNKVNTIVMLTDDEDCVSYWPLTATENLKSGDITITLLDEKVNDLIVERSLRVSGEEQETLVSHLQYTGWKSNGCPENGHSILELMEDMQINARQEMGSAVLIHCSDGVGRTGTFCTIVNLIDRLKYESRIDVFRAVKDLRDCKQGMVQTLDEYIFCHQVIIDYLKSVEIYSNFE